MFLVIVGVWNALDASVGDGEMSSVELADGFFVEVAVGGG